MQLPKPARSGGAKDGSSDSIEHNIFGLGAINRIYTCIYNLHVCVDTCYPLSDHEASLHHNQPWALFGSYYLLRLYIQSRLTGIQQGLKCSRLFPPATRNALFGFIAKQRPMAMHMYNVYDPANPIGVATTPAPNYNFTGRWLLLS